MTATCSSVSAGLPPLAGITPALPVKPEIARLKDEGRIAPEQVSLGKLNNVREAIAIAGGIILFIIALRLIFPRPEGVLGDLPDGEPMLVPLATPAVAGPSALAVLMTSVNIFGGFLVTRRMLAMFQKS